MLRKYKAPVVAVSFDWGKGQVFHVISHFWAKRSQAPTSRHRQPCTDFPTNGMGLSEKGVEKVLSQVKIQPDTINFGQLQSAATATKLIAQLCVGSVRGAKLQH